jgi:very-short-patch-repair endonuclease
MVVENAMGITEDVLEEVDEQEEDTVEKVFEEAEEKYQLLNAAKVEAENGGWIEPHTPEDYLMWFDYIVEKYIRDAFEHPAFRSVWLSFVHAAAGYAAQLRCFCIQPSLKPWECGMMKIDQEIVAGLEKLNSMAYEYARIAQDHSVPAYSKYYLSKRMGEFEEIYYASSEEMETKYGYFSQPAILLRNISEQLCYAALSHSAMNPLQKVDICESLKKIWAYADLYACKPKEAMHMALTIWNYRIEQCRKGQPSDPEVEYQLLFPHKIPEKAPQFDSPIEKLFWDTWKLHSQYALASQHTIGRYRVDFAHLPTKTAIELDGLEAHRTTEQIAYDRRRQREIEAQGWRFIRFGGKEVYQDVVRCVMETSAFIHKQTTRKPEEET